MPYEGGEYDISHFKIEEKAWDHYPVNIALEMYAAIPRSHLWIVPNGGHGPIFGDMAAQFAETSLTFLRGEWKDQSP